MKRYGFLSVALAAALTVGCNSSDRKDTSAANPPGGGAVGTAGSDNVSSGDKDFVKDIASASIAEVELGRMALDKAVNPDVKKFAQMMVDDHTKANEELTTFASQNNIAVPSAPDDKHNDLRDKLAQKTGAEFDKDYMDAMVDGHQDVADKLESRIDKDTLTKYKAEARDASGNKVDTKVEATAVTPEKSDNPVTMGLNSWAAKTYPVVRAHLDAAKKLQDTVKKRMTN
jgi:putative membrane protein